MPSNFGKIRIPGTKLKKIIICATIMFGFFLISAWGLSASSVWLEWQGLQRDNKLINPLPKWIYY
jgi:hypothetical protein